MHLARGQQHTSDAFHETFSTPLNNTLPLCGTVCVDGGPFIDDSEYSKDFRKCQTIERFTSVCSFFDFPDTFLVET